MKPWITLDLIHEAINNQTSKGYKPTGITMGTEFHDHLLKMVIWLAPISDTSMKGTIILGLPVRIDDSVYGFIVESEHSPPRCTKEEIRALTITEQIPALVTETNRIVAGKMKNEDYDDFEENLKAVFDAEGVDLGPSEPPSLERLKENLEAWYPDTKPPSQNDKNSA